MNNTQRQQDEIVALRAIFGESAVVLETNQSALTQFVLHVPLASVAGQADIRFYFPATYPSKEPPVFEWISAQDTQRETETLEPGFMYPPDRHLPLSKDMRDEIEKELFREWEEDMCFDVVVFSWVTWLGGYFEQRWPQPADPIPLPKEAKKAVKEKSQTDEQNERVSNDVAKVNVPAIYTGEMLEMKKSVFIAHVAHVTSGEDVKAVRDRLMQDKKIAQAAHNILAYRIRVDNGSLSQDNDDDGETAAGRRLGHLLQLLGVENAVVVVTRWYGGIHLGPDRFKLINNAARQALEAGGFLNSAK